jgi:ATPase subunit of ABC transporter with duplicated ATPase domains
VVFVATLRVRLQRETHATVLVVSHDTGFLDNVCTVCKTTDKTAAKKKHLKNNDNNRKKASIVFLFGLYALSNA